VRFVSAYDKLVVPNASGIGANAGGKVGAYSDFLHFMPYGAYLFAGPLVDALKQDYPKEQSVKSSNAIWDSTLKVGALNLNPMLRGVAGTATGPRLIGTVPDGYSIAATGTTQNCTTAFEAASDGGIDWFTLAADSATAGDYHEVTQFVTIPAGFVAGDYFQVSSEVMLYATPSLGLAIVSIQVNATGNLNADYLFNGGRDIATFTTEQPVLHFRSEPQKLIAGVTVFTMRIRVGAKTGGGSGKVGFRKFKIEKASGPAAV